MWSYYRWIRNQVAAEHAVGRVGPRAGDRHAAARWKTARPTSSCCTRTRPTWPRRRRVAFLGMSINCAKCHNHPLEKWTNDQYYGMANLFARVRTKDAPGDGNRMVFAATDGELVQPRTGKPQPPRRSTAKPWRRKAAKIAARQIKGIREEDMITLMVGEKYGSVISLLEAGVSVAALERLADADAFRSIGLDRRNALWEVSALADRPDGMFTGQTAAKPSEQHIQLPGMSLSEHVIRDYGAMGLSLKAHPVSFVRERLAKLNIHATGELVHCKNGMPVKVAGLVLVRQRPGTAKGVCFITIEDETGTANLVVFESLFQKYRKEIMHSHLLMVEGNVQIEGEVVHVIVKRCYNLSSFLSELTQVESDKQPVQTLARADEKDDSVYPAQNKETRIRKMVQGEIFPSGRNFK